jgi:sugar transferase (PEP-CTERM/EpsH1 system associated)
VTAGTLVVHVVHSLDVGGLENGVVNLVNGPDSAFRHAIVCLARAGQMRARVRPGVEVHTVGKGTGHDLRALARTTRLLRALRPAVVHSRNWPAFDAVLAARLARVHYVVHGEHGRDATDPQGRNRRRNLLRRLSNAFISRFVTVSEDLRRWLVGRVGIPARKVVTIPNGVDTVRFAPRDKATARTALGLPPERRVVGTVGRLDPVKDQAGLVRAFASLTEAGAETLLVIAGDGPCRGSLQALIEAEGLGRRVHLLGQRDDVPQVLAAMDVFVLSSLAEGMSNTILEAMATGLPIVATRVGGTPELVQDDVDGLLVPARNPPALAGALARYLGDPELRIAHGRAARRRALDAFSLDRMRATYEALYRHVVGLGD